MTPIDFEQRRAFAHLIRELRLFQDATAGSAPPAEVCLEVASRLGEARARLDKHYVAEAGQLFNRLPEVPGYGQAFTPTFEFEMNPGKSVEGRVTFTRFHLGGNAAAHGGGISLLFDSVMGRLANSLGTRARTVHLEVDYQHITPLDVPLRVEGRITSIDGRKRYVEGSLTNGENLCARAYGIFVELLPGQQ